MMSFIARILAGFLVVILLPAASAWSQAKEPPSCSAITFRPLTPDAGEGDQDAGLYKSRFGRIMVKGTVKSGRVETHYVTVNNNRPGAAQTLPASVASCAQTKKLPALSQAPSQAAAGSCVGDKLQVLVSHDGGKRYVLLYARDGGKWQLCSAGTA